jgi:hypothetical protein
VHCPENTSWPVTLDYNIALAVNSFWFRLSCFVYSLYLHLTCAPQNIVRYDFSNAKHINLQLQQYSGNIIVCAYGCHHYFLLEFLPGNLHCSYFLSSYGILEFHNGYVWSFLYCYMKYFVIMLKWGNCGGRKSSLTLFWCLNNLFEISENISTSQL